MLSKPTIHAAFLTALNSQIDLLQTTLADLKYSASNETKSTAGDKHETALAHLQIQQDQVRTQLSKLETSKASLHNLKPEIINDEIRLGSVIETNHGVLYMSVALPAITIEGLKVIAMSPASPLGAKLLGLKQGAMLAFNNIKYEIINVM